MRIPGSYGRELGVEVLEPVVVRVSASYGNTELAACTFQVRGDVADTAPPVP